MKVVAGLAVWVDEFSAVTYETEKFFKIYGRMATLIDLSLTSSKLWTTPFPEYCSVPNQSSRVVRLCVCFSRVSSNEMLNCQKCRLGVTIFIAGGARERLATFLICVTDKFMNN